MFTQASGSENTIEGRLLPLRACSAGVVAVNAFPCSKRLPRKSSAFSLYLKVPVSTNKQHRQHVQLCESNPQWQQAAQNQT